MNYFKKINFLSVLFLILIGMSLSLKIVRAEDVCCCDKEKSEYFDASECNKKENKDCSVMPKEQCKPSSGDSGNTATPPKSITLTDPLKLNASGQEVQVLIGRVIQAILGLVGSIALLMFVYGGFMWMTAAGNEERVKKGKDVLVWASLGLAVIFASYIMVYFILKTLLGLSV